MYAVLSPHRPEARGPLSAVVRPPQRLPLNGLVGACGNSVRVARVRRGVAITLSADVRALIDGPNFATVATLDPDGGSQTSVVQPGATAHGMTRCWAGAYGVGFSCMFRSIGTNRRPKSPIPEVRSSRLKSSASFRPRCLVSLRLARK